MTATFTYQHPFKGDLYPVTREATQYDPRSDHDWLCELVAYHTGEAWWVENTDTDRVVFTDIGRGRFLRIHNDAGDVTMRCYNKDGFQVAAITWHADERDQFEAMLTWLTN